MSSANSESFTSSFQFKFLLFLFLLWLLWPKLCWIVMVKVGTLVLFLTLGEMLSVFHHEDNVCCGFVIYSFYYVEVCSFYSCFLESFFNHKWMLYFVKGFLCIYWDNHMAFIFQFVNVVYYIDLLWILKNPCIPGIKPTWKTFKMTRTQSTCTALFQKKVVKAVSKERKWNFLSSLSLDLCFSL